VNRIVTFVGLYLALRSRLHREDGQTMAEYGVVLAVITVFVVLALTALALGISGKLNAVTAILK
jgi:Flp pilus assembly pilin Flp